MADRCPACDGGLVVAWRTAAAAEPGWADVALARCVTCGTAVTLGPAAPEELHDSGAYRPGRPRGAGLAAPLLARFDRARLRLHALGTPPRTDGGPTAGRARDPADGLAVPPVGAGARGEPRTVGGPPVRLIDAGAGRGRFVAAARAAGYAAEGIEPSARGVDGALATYGVALTRASIDGFTPAVPVDSVSLWHVLEHVEDPAATIATLRGWLVPGGTLVVGVPNLSSLQARLGGERWYHLDLPRHRTHFTARGLRTLLDREGFEVLRERQVLLEHNPFGLWQTVVSRCTERPSYLYNLLKRNAPARSRDLAVTLALVPLAPFAAVLELLAGLARRGGTVAVVARKRN